MRIAILGAGPSGMMAAHAASDCGHHVSIFDKNPSQSRRNSGVYYLHDDCNLALDEVRIKQRILGVRNRSEEEIALDYGMKVYGKKIKKVSILNALREKEIKGYNSGQAIERLWDLYSGQIRMENIPGMDWITSIGLSLFDKVISTIPASVLFPPESIGIEYQYSTAWIKVGKAPENEAFVFYNVNKNCQWYRSSAMFGVFIQEYGVDWHPNHQSRMSHHSVSKVTKIIGTSAPLPVIDNVFCVGRYGSWDKTCLTHNVYYRTLEWLKDK